MTSNATRGGSTFRGRHPDLWYWERLPPTARKALAEAAFDWSSGWLYGLWNRGKLKTGAKSFYSVASSGSRDQAAQVIITVGSFGLTNTAGSRPSAMPPVTKQKPSESNR